MRIEFSNFYLHDYSINRRTEKARMEHFKTLLYNFKVLCDGTKLFEQITYTVTKFEITVVFLLPVGSILTRKANYRLVSPHSYAPFHCARITMGKQ